jgi:hypothetical protein
MKKAFLFVVLIVLITSCSSNHIVKYVYTLDNVISEEPDYVKKDIVYGRYRNFYSDNNIEMLFDFDSYEIGVQFKNKSWDTLRIIWDDIYLETNIDSIKKFKLVHTNFKQENISLSDTTIEDYLVLKLIKEQQLKDTTYNIRPTILLPGMIINDVILNKDQGYFLPYEMRDTTSLNKLALNTLDKSAALHFTYKINSKRVSVILNLKIKDYYLLRRG